MDRTIGSITEDELAAHAALGGTPTPRRYAGVSLPDGRTGVVVGYSVDAPKALVRLDAPGGVPREQVYVAFTDLTAND